MTHLPSLIPASRVTGTARLRRRTHWGVAIVVQGIITISLCLPALYQTSARYLTLGEDVRRLEASIADVEQRTRRLEGVAAEARAKLEIADSLTGHPDWSLLFPILSKAIAGRALIQELVVAPLGETGGFTIQLRGRSPSTRIVSDIALSLEGTALITSARVDSTTRIDPTTASFTVQCEVLPRRLSAVGGLEP